LITAIYTINTFTVKWYDGDYHVYHTSYNVPYNTYLSDIIPEGSPTKQPSDQYTYTFAGWDIPVSKQQVTHDEYIYSKFTQVTRSYTVSYYAHRGETSPISTESVEYGSKCTSVPTTAISGMTLFKWTN